MVSFSHGCIVHSPVCPSFLVNPIQSDILKSCISKLKYLYKVLMVLCPRCCCCYNAEVRHVCWLELQTNLREDYAMFYNHGEGLIVS